MAEGRPWYLSAPEPSAGEDATAPTPVDAAPNTAMPGSRNAPGEAELFAREPGDELSAERGMDVRLSERSATAAGGGHRAPTEPSALSVRRRGRIFAIVGGLLGIITATAVSLWLHGTGAADQQHSQTASGVQGTSQVAPAAPASSSTASASTTTAPTSGTAFAEELGRSGLESLLLGSSDIAGKSADVAVKGGATTSWVSIQHYLDGYQGSTVPSQCAVARGLMVLTDLDTPSSEEWARPSILRVQNLHLGGSPQLGSQQIRQFANEAEAIAFMQHQASWFTDCSSVRFTWKGSTDDVSYQGRVVEQQGTDEVLAIGAVSGLSTSTAEFDGWIRRGPVVYASYLLGNSSTPAGQLEQAGRDVAAAAQDKLARAAAS